MGIYHFFGWFRKQFRPNIRRVYMRDLNGKKRTLTGVYTDVFALDMNSILHNSAQFVYRYGKYTSNGFVGEPSLEQVQKHITTTLTELVEFIQPKKTLLLCIDGPAPMSKCCLAEGSKVTLSNGTSIPIENIQPNDLVLGWNNKGFTSTKAVGLEHKGIKETIKITMFDGRELICTKDHKILILENNIPSWKEAGLLAINDKIIGGINSPLDIVENNEQFWKLSLPDITYDLKPENRAKTLAFMRILGILLTDGYISQKKCGISLGTRLDSEDVNQDIFLLTGKKPLVYKATGDKGTVYTLSLPSELGKIIRSIPGIQIGKRVTTPYMIPYFLSDENCPNCIVREFLGALFGGDGSTTGFSSSDKSDCFLPVSFTKTVIEQHKESLQDYLITIQKLLEKIGISDSKISNSYVVNCDKFKPKDGLTRLRFNLDLPSNSLFGSLIGFRYSLNKALKLEISTSYNKFNEHIKKGYFEIIDRASNLYDNQKPDYRCKYCNATFASRKSLTRHQKQRCIKNYTNDQFVEPSHLFLHNCLDKAIDEYKSENYILHPKMIPTLSNFQNVRFRGHNKTDRRLRYGINVKEYLEMLGCKDWFEPNTRPLDQEDTYIPSYTIPIIDIREHINLPVYDIEVEGNHSFLTNGLCVHNCQQRKRRFKSAMESSSEAIFDSNAITPGTEFMHSVCSHIEDFVQEKIQSDPVWRNLDVVFSSEKTPGEGEQKIMSYIRKYGNRSDSYCIYGPDADLIMLALSTHLNRISVLRDDMNPNAFNLINVNRTHQDLAELLRWNSDKFVYNANGAIDDFVFLCFAIGNDFLPHIPSLEILESGIEIIIEIYKEVGEKFGHIVQRGHRERDNLTFNKAAFAYFLECVTYFEKPLLEKKVTNTEYFEDALLQSCQNGTELDINKYREEYSKKYFDNIEEAVVSYIKGLDWVLTYYKIGVPCWNWSYQYHYAPIASDILKYIGYYRKQPYKRSAPLLPFQQLLTVLPPKSASLLPEPISVILNTETKFKKQFCPEKPEIDLSGKRNEWQAIVLLPKLQLEDVLKVYKTKSHLIKEEEQKRNKFELTVVYSVKKDKEEITL